MSYGRWICYWIHVVQHIIVRGFHCCLYCLTTSFRFCRFEEFVNTIIVDVGGKKVQSFLFRVHGDNFIVRWEGHLKHVVENHGELSNYMIQLVRTWLNLVIENVKYHVWCIYLSLVLCLHMKMNEITAKRSIYGSYTTNMGHSLP